MMRRWLGLGLALAASAAVGCGDTPRSHQSVFDSAAGGSGGAGGLGGSGARPDAGLGGSVVATGGAAGSSATGGWAGWGGAGGAAGAAGAPVLVAPAPVGLASLNSDYATTSLSLLKPTGGVLMSPCVRSSSIPNSSSKTISGDAVLPSQPQRGGYLVMVDRIYGVLDFVDTSSCFIARQIAVPGGGKTNPHDIVVTSDHRAYVTRYDADSTASSPQQVGNDVIVIDPTNGTFISRISLDGYASSGGNSGPVLARPDRALIAGGMIAVSLNQIDATFSTYGDGAVVFIDPATNAVAASVPLPGLYNCEGMDYIASSSTLLVSCGGGYSNPNRPLQSGIAVIDLSASPPRLDHVISSIAFDGRPLDFSWVLSAATPSWPTRAFTGSTDPASMGPDAMFQFDFASGAVVQVTTAPSFTLGAPAVSGPNLLVPEALKNAPMIQLFDVSGPITTAPRSVATFNPDLGNSLPPRQVAWY
jgi:hypothetical protein